MPGALATMSNARVLMRLYNLTPGEMSICMMLAKGQSVQESAMSLGISYENARHKLKIIFQKTDVRNQADLRVLLSRI